jgi:hypothetical protein
MSCLRLMVQGCFLRPPPNAGGAEVPAEVEGRQGSASSSDEHPASVSVQASPRERAKPHDAAAVQKEAACQKQVCSLSRRNRTMPDAGHQLIVRGIAACIVPPRISLIL